MNQINELTWTCHAFSELSSQELYTILKLREEVFILEQKCLYPDIDGKDFLALHLLGRSHQDLVAYARLFEAGAYFSEASAFGRVVTAPSVRGLGVGKQLARQCIIECKKRWPHASIQISGQYYLLEFYQQLGFNALGNVYLEDGIEHICLRYD